MEAQNIIIGGDLNVCLDPTLDRRSTARTSSLTDARPYRDRIKALCDSLLLSGIWRQLNPSVRAYMLRRGQYASRLDLWLVSDHLMGPHSTARIIPCVLSDHEMVTLKVGSKQQQNGPGLWRFDNTLLQNKQYLVRMKEMFNELGDMEDLSDPNSRWEWLQFKVQTVTTQFSKATNIERKNHE